MNLDELNGKSLSLIVWNTKKEDDAHVYLGKLYLENGEGYFINQEKGWKVSLDEEQLNRIDPVPGDLKEMLLDADYALSMSMGDLPDTNTEEFKATGIKWHE